MHTTTPDTRTVRYRERLTPPLWVLAACALFAPMAALVFVPIDATLALIAGIVVGVAVVLGLIAASPRIQIDDDQLRVGRAHIAHRYLGAAEALTGDAARAARGPGLQRSWWHLIRGGVDGLVIVAIDDPGDPVTAWAFSSRTPERIVSVLTHRHTRAQS